MSNPPLIPAKVFGFDWFLFILGGGGVLLFSPRFSSKKEVRECSEFLSSDSATS